MAIYVKNPEIQREMIICKGKGKLSSKGQKYLMLIADNVALKFKHLYQGTPDNFYDCKMEALLMLFSQWKKYDCTMDNPLSYYTEIYKRAMSAAYSKVVLKKGNYTQETVEFVRIDIYHEKRNH
jgi:hypothetical protein